MSASSQSTQFSHFLRTCRVMAHTLSEAVKLSSQGMAGRGMGMPNSTDNQGKKVISIVVHSPQAAKKTMLSVSHCRPVSEDMGIKEVLCCDHCHQPKACIPINMNCKTISE